MTITFNELLYISDMESDSGEGDGIVLWGWERFFTELSSFLRNIDRQYMVVNEQFSEYVIYRAFGNNHCKCFEFD